MNVYLALEKYNNFNSGEFTRILAVCSSPEKAKEAFKYSTWFDKCNKTTITGLYGVIGEDTVSLDVEIATIDEEFV